MSMNRRDCLAAVGILGLAGCARIEQSRLGRLTPDMEFRKSGPPRFAVLGDLHLLDSRSVGIVGRAVNAINNDESIDFAVVVGGLTTHGTLPQMNLARQAFDRLHVPVHCVPGPQDVRNDSEAPRAFYERVFEKSQWRLNTGGWTLIGIDSSAGDEASGGLSEDSLAWLQNQVGHLDPQRPVAIFCHHPLAPGVVEGRMSAAGDVLALFADHNLRLVASGHLHENRVAEEGGVLFVSTAPCSTTVDPADEDGMPGYRVFTLDGGQIHHEFIPVPL